MKQPLEPRKLDAGQAPDLRLIIEPDPRLRDRIGQLDREASQALHEFESLRDFPKIVTDMHDKLGKLQRQIEHQGGCPTAEEWANLVIARFDIRAGGFFKLVSTLEIQNAFIVMIHQLRRTAWQEYVNLEAPAELVQPEGSKSLAMEKAIFDRGQYWVTKGYRRLANAGMTLSALESVSRGTSATEEGAKRRAVVDSFLLRCNQEAEVDVRLIRKHIWRAANHKSARQFQYWQSSDPLGMTAESERNFQRILAMTPAEFVALLKKMKLI